MSKFKKIIMALVIVMGIISSAAYTYKSVTTLTSTSKTATQQGYAQDQRSSGDQVITSANAAFTSDNSSQSFGGGGDCNHNCAACTHRCH